MFLTQQNTMYFTSYKFSFFNNQPCSVVGKNKNGIHKFGFVACKSKTPLLPLSLVGTGLAALRGRGSAWRCQYPLRFGSASRSPFGLAKPITKQANKGSASNPMPSTKCLAQTIQCPDQSNAKHARASKGVEKSKYWKKDNKFFTSDRTSIISRANNINNFNSNKQLDNKQEVVSITYEEIGLFPRSFSRVLDRFLKQVFSDVENLVIQEYRFYRYLFLTTLKCLLILFFIPFFVNLIAKTYIVRPLTEYFWNTKQTEIFLNSSQQKHAFAELKEFEEKTYFESLIFPKSVFTYNNVDSNLQLPINETKDPLVFTNKLPTSQVNNTFDVHDIAPLALVERGPGQVAFDSDVTPKNAQSPLSPFSVREKWTNEEQMMNGPLFREEVEPRNSVLRVVQSAGLLPLQGKSVSADTVNQSNTRSPYGATALFIYETQEADKNLQQRYQEKTIELAQRYNDQSVEAITNIFADLISLLTLFYLLYALEIQINITKSFLLEVFFGLDDSKKSLLILLVTDLLVGYHSSNLWELFFEFLFHHYGLPESQTGVFLLVATLPVLLDVLFKYLIFRHLNRSSPATVATYHAMIE